MDKTVSQNIRLGVLVITGLAIFVAAIYVLGNKQSMFGKTIEIFATFTNVNGLLVGNNVRYAGIDAGVVKKIEMMNDTSIKVTMDVEKSIALHIRKDALAGIGSDGLVGNMIINITPGKGTAGPVQSGDQIKTLLRVSTDEILNTLKVTNENAALLTADLVKITGEVLTGKGMIGMLLNDQQLATDLKDMIHSLKVTSIKADQSVRELQSLISALNNKNNVLGVVQDTAVARQIKGILTTLEASSKEINQAAKQANATITNLKEGKGAVNYLSNDPELVQKIGHTMVKIDTTIDQINQAGIKLNENLEALKHNIFFRGYFRNLEKQQNNEKQ